MSCKHKPFVALLLILVGCVFLARNLGFISRDFLHTWWPLFLIAAGGLLWWRSRP